jgi:hypothetical protein
VERKCVQKIFTLCEAYIWHVDRQVCKAAAAETHKHAPCWFQETTTTRLPVDVSEPWAQLGMEAEGNQ